MSLATVLCHSSLTFPLLWRRMYIWFGWLLSYSLATERKRNTGLLRMESYAAVLNISAFLGPGLREIGCSSSTSSTRGRAAPEGCVLKQGGASTCKGELESRAALGKLHPKAGQSPWMCLLFPRAIELHALSFAIVAEEGESTKVMENKTLIFRTSCVTSKLQLYLYPQHSVHKSGLLSSKAFNENY